MRLTSSGAPLAMHSPTLITCTRSARSLTICRSLDPQNRYLPIKPQPQDEAGQILLLVARQTAPRLIEQEESGIRGHCPGKADDLLLPIGQVVRADVAQRPKLEEIDDALHGFALGDLLRPSRAEEYRCGKRVAMELTVARHKQILDHRQRRKQLEILETARDAQSRGRFRRATNQLLSVEQDVSGLWPVNPADAVEDSSLAGSIGADQGGYLSRQRFERDTAQNVEAAEAQRQVLDVQQAVHR
jgi:hypothetical protein